MISSMEYNLPPGTRVELYQDRNFGGPVLVTLRGKGVIPTLPESQNDGISSVKWISN